VTAETQAFFIVSSGRSGTAMLQKALSAAGDIEMQHEYAVDIVQPLAVRRYLGLAGEDETRAVLGGTHVAAIRYSEAAHWGDSSNKLSWLIPELACLQPQAKFVHLVRDGRKVSSSYFHKLSAECYDDRSTAILQAFYDDPAAKPAPPPEKKYWWTCPRKENPLAKNFRSFDQFQRIAWHWAEVNRVILEALEQIAASRKYFARLEELQDSADAVRELFGFLNLDYRHDHFQAFARPHNVNRPEDRLLDERQRNQFDSLAAPMMGRLGYADRPEYVVNY
jgi:hypothetical protein